MNKLPVWNEFLFAKPSCSLVFLTNTWFNGSVTDTHIDRTGYQMIKSNKGERVGGGDVTIHVHCPMFPVTPVDSKFRTQSACSDVFCLRILVLEG